MAHEKLNISVLTADNLVFEGEVAAVSSFNEKGKFDVLPFHTNFITLIKDKLFIHHTLKNTQEIPFSSGVMRVLENKVIVFIGPEVLGITV